MTRSRARLFLFALALILLPIQPGVAGGEEGTPAPAVAPVASPLALDRCSETAVSPGPVELIFPPPDFILCTCKFCRANPQVECQISPDGYSILCADWLLFHC